jgi:glycogen debranching enzyme
MTGLYLSTLDSLAQLAEALNRTVLASELRARHAAMAMSVNELLWDDAQSVYANRFLNGTFSQRISPFNFHVMLSGAATVERVDAMVSKWLLTDEGFCLTDKSKTKSSTYTAGGGAGAAAAASASMPCRYGLPSIAHSDAAFTDQNYWRGRTWGPMNYLVYIGLDHPKYAALASVQVAKKRLANASLSLLMGEWLTNHHVCENYNAETGVGGGPRPKGGGSSNPFYHWGGLLGYVSLIEHKLV